LAVSAIALELTTRAADGVTNVARSRTRFPTASADGGRTTSFGNKVSAAAPTMILAMASSEVLAETELT
jgi:hypothetical protein